MSFRNENPLLFRTNEKSIYKYQKQIVSIESEKTGLEYPFNAGAWDLTGEYKHQS